MSFWHVYLGIYGGGGTPPSGGAAGSFTITLVPNGACGGDPPDTSSEGACYRPHFGALEMTGVRFNKMELVTTPWFGALEQTGVWFGKMRAS